MTKEDVTLIKRLYREALHKSNQIAILSQTFAISEATIEAIVGITNTKKELHAKFERLYYLENNDYTIAWICGVDKEEVRGWRIQHNLKTHIQRKDVINLAK